MNDPQQYPNQQAHYGFDLENSELAPKNEATNEIYINYPEQVENLAVPTRSLNLVRHWLAPILPFLKPGGKSVALILALGVVSIPLLASGNALVAPILAFGAVTVAILSCT